MVGYFPYTVDVAVCVYGRREPVKGDSLVHPSRLRTVDSSRMD